MKIKLLREDAILPTFANFGDAGLDLHIPDDVTIFTNELRKIPLGFAIEIPSNHVGLVLDRSSIATKFHIKTMGGVIDSTYRGELFVNLKNLHTTRMFWRGDKIAQLLIIPILTPTKDFLTVVTELSETNRGEKGFGSSGKGLEEGHSAMMCTHANEVPMNCPCDDDCYCKTHTCKNKSLNKVIEGNIVHFYLAGNRYTSCGQPTIIVDNATTSLLSVNCEKCLKMVKVNYSEDIHWHYQISDFTSPFVEVACKEVDVKNATYIKAKVTCFNCKKVMNN